MGPAQVESDPQIAANARILGLCPEAIERGETTLCRARGTRSAATATVSRPASAKTSQSLAPIPLDAIVTSALRRPRENHLVQSATFAWPLPRQLLSPTASGNRAIVPRQQKGANRGDQSAQAEQCKGPAPAAGAWRQIQNQAERGRGDRAQSDTQD